MRTIVRVLLPVLLAAFALPRSAAADPAFFFTTMPCRIFDSRTTNAPALQHGVPRNIQVGGVCDVPTTASAAAFNVTVTQPTADGDLVLYPGDGAVPAPPRPGALPFKAGKTRAKVDIVQLASDGGGDVNALATMSPGATVELILDVFGYFVDNLPPVANDDTATFTEDDPATAIPVLANDSDPEGDPFFIASASDPANGTVVLTGGSPGAHTGLTYQPDPNYCNTPPGTTLDTFTYTLTPGGDTATVSVTVNCVNDNPVANDDSATVTEDAAATPIPVLANDTDADSDPFTIASASDPANGTVVLTGGSPGAHTGLTYQPDPNYCNNPPGTTPDTFTYTLNPGGDTATVSVTVDCANDNPVANDDTATLTEDDPATAIDVLANDTDTEGDPFTIASASDPANGTVVLTGGSPGAHTGLTYQPDPNYCNNPPGTTPDTFTYTLNPGGDTATVSVTVNCVNDNPVANDDTATLAEDDPATAIDVLANDTDAESDPFTIASASDPANGTVVLTGGSPGAHTGLTYQPDPNYCNNPPGTTPDTFTYTLNPGGDTATVSVTVNCANDNPVANDDTATLTEDDPATAINVLANDTDAEGDPFTIASASDPANGTVVLTGGSPGAHTGLTYQPDPNYCNNPPGTTPDTFTYTLNPGGDTATVSVTVNCVDDKPTATNDTAAVSEDSSNNVIDVLANDPDPDGGPAPGFSVTDPPNGTATVVSGVVHYTPDPNYCNNPPGSVLDSFTYTINPPPAGNTATVTVTVNCVDDPPVAVADTKTVDEDSGATSIDVLANDTDVDGGPKTIASATDPANGTVVVAGDNLSLTYQPDSNYCNSVSGIPDTFNYTLNGGSSAMVSVTVTCVDDPPVAVADTKTVNEDSGATSIDVLANDTDVDGGPKTIASATDPANGTVVVAGDNLSLTYQPDPNYCNSVSGIPDTFNYTLTPGGSSTTVSVTVTCVDDPPVAVADAATVDEDSGANAIDVLANDTDIDGGPKTVNAVQNPSTFGGTVLITGGGTGVSYNPALNYCNNPPGTTLDTFTYTLNGGSMTTVTVTVTCINDPPVLTDTTPNYVATGNTQLRAGGTPPVVAAVAFSTDAGSVLANGKAGPITDVDGPGPTEVVPASSASANGGAFTIQADGDFTYHPPTNFTGTDTFAVQITDNGAPAAIANATVTIAVSEMVWYVQNNTATPGTAGTSVDPFDMLSEAQSASGANHYIFVFGGDGTTNKQNAGIVLKSGQHLIGEAVSLVVSGQTLVTGNPANRPLLDNTGGNGVSATDVIPIEIVGLSLAGSVNAIDLTNGVALPGGATLSIQNDVIRGAGAEGIDVNLNAGTTGTLTLAIQNNTWNTAGTHTGNAVDILRSAGTLNLNFSGNTNIKSNATAVLINGGAVANTTITGFSSNAVHGDTLGGGVAISNATFDAVAGGGIQQVDGDNLAIGASGNPVGGAGMSLTTVLGNLFFDDLDIFAGTSGLTINGAMTFAVTPAPPDGSGTSTIDADNGAAVDVTSATIDLRLDDLDSTTSGSGVSLSSVGGSFKTDSDASISKSSGGGTAFSIASSSVTSNYAGTLNVTSGSGVGLSNNTGAANFTGQLTLNTGTNPAFSATGSSGTVTATNANNTIVATTGTALNVNGPDIGVGGLVFQSISANGAANGIIVQDTGSTAGLTVSGTGSAGTGGTIQNITTRGASFVNAVNISLTSMNFTNANTTDGATSDGVVGGNENTDENGAIHLQGVTTVDLTSLSINGAVQHGINGNNVTDLDITNTTIQNCGDEAWESGIYMFDLKGLSSAGRTSVFNNLDITNDSGQFNIALLNDDGTNDRPAEKDRLEITNSQFTRNGNNALISDNVTILNSGTANFQVVVTGSTFDSTVTCGSPGFNGACVSDSIQVDAGNTAAFDASITGNDFDSSFAGQSAVNMTASSSGQGTFTVSNNGTMTVRAGVGINVSLASATATGSLRGTIANNVITTNVSNNSGAAINIVANDQGTIVANVNNNSVTGSSPNWMDQGIRGHARGSAALHLTLDNNSVQASEFEAADLSAGNGTAGETATTCVRFVSNNLDAGTGGIFDYLLSQYTGTTFQIQGLSGSGSSESNVEAFVAATDDDPAAGDPTVEAFGGTIVNYTNAVCQTP